MDYKLAKELKDAGFPQGSGDVGEGGWVDERHGWTVYDDGRIYCPTLEELIDACGADFNQLIRYSDESGWGAFGLRRNMATAPTPTEAVARLWLALNSTPKQPQEDNSSQSI